MTTDQLTERDGIVYELSTQKPFTGVIKEKATKGKDGYEGAFIYGKPEGTHRKFTEKDSIIFECNYDDGKLHGSYVVNHKNGTDVFYYKHGVKDGLQFEYYDHQRTKKKFSQNFKDGEVDGEMCYYYPNGNLEEQKMFKDGMLNGEHTRYGEDGTLHLKEYYVDNVRNGLSLEYFEDGTIKNSANYKNGKLHGKYISYSSDGAKWVEIDYIGGNKHGKDIMYGSDGEPSDVRIYKHGKEM